MEQRLSSGPVLARLVGNSFHVWLLFCFIFVLFFLQTVSSRMPRMEDPNPEKSEAEAEAEADNRANANKFRQLISAEFAELQLR